MRIVQNFINGEAVPAIGGEWSDLINPATEERIGKAALSRAEDVNRAYESSRKAARTWNNTISGERQLLLNRLADEIEKQAAEFADLECAETGKPRSTIEAWEIAAAVDDLRFFAGAARHSEGRAAGEYLRGHTSTIRREPIGVVGQIAPWNYPLVMAIWKVAPALAAGNTTVLKPSDTTPSTAFRLAEIANHILGPGILNVVTGDKETGKALAESKVPGLVSLTGSVAAGRSVAQKAGMSLTRLHLELGGKAAAVVAQDVDVQAVAGALMLGSFFNAGQDCTAATRYIVHESVYESFLSGLMSSISRIRVGGPEEENIFYGALNNARQLAQVQGFIDRLPLHAKVLYGGKRLNRKGYFFPPTIITDVYSEDEIVQNEVFGPVVTIQKYQTDDEALQLANGTEYGLASSIWTNDLTRANRFSRDMESGCVWVNCHMMLTPEMPQGGFKQSGYGKDLSTYALEEYTRVKHVMTFIGDTFPSLGEDGQLIM